MFALPLRRAISEYPKKRAHVEPAAPSTHDMNRHPKTPKALAAAVRAGRWRRITRGLVPRGPLQVMTVLWPQTDRMYIRVGYAECTPAGPDRPRCWCNLAGDPLLVRPTYWRAAARLPFVPDTDV